MSEKENKSAEGTKPAEEKKEVVTVETMQILVDDQASQINDLTAKNSELEAELEVYKAKYSDVSGETPGTYTSKKLKGPSVKFKTGCVQFPFNGEIIQSKDALKDAEVMDALITMGAGIIEIVNA